MAALFQRHNGPLAVLALAFLAALGTFLFFGRDGRIEKSPKLAVSRAEVVHESQNQRLQKFSLTGFDEKGKKFWNLEGDAAKIDPGQTIYLDQNVTLKLKNDTVVRTDHVQWSQNGGTLTTDSEVFVDHQNLKVHGIGALGLPNDSFIQLNRNIQMVINLTTHLECSGPMKIYYKENRMIFYRNVKVTDERGTLTAKRMEVLFDANEKKVEKIIASGSVVIERGTDTTRSARAIYTLATGSVRLEGSPEITLHKGGSTILDGALRN